MHTASLYYTTSVYCIFRFLEQMLKNTFKRSREKRDKETIGMILYPIIRSQMRKQMQMDQSLIRKIIILNLINIQKK